MLAAVHWPPEDVAQVGGDVLPTWLLSKPDSQVADFAYWYTMHASCLGLSWHWRTGWCAYSARRGVRAKGRISKI